MQKIIIYDAETDCPIEIAYKEEPELWVEHGALEGRWGKPDDFYFEISDFSNDTEPKGIIISAESPENPKDAELWLQKTTRTLYSWKEESEKWLSADRAVFIPEENLRSTPVEG